MAFKTFHFYSLASLADSQSLLIIILSYFNYSRSDVRLSKGIESSSSSSSARDRGKPGSEGRQEGKGVEEAAAAAVGCRQTQGHQDQVLMTRGEAMDKLVTKRREKERGTLDPRVTALLSPSQSLEEELLFSAATLCLPFVFMCLQGT